MNIYLHSIHRYQYVSDLVETPLKIFLPLHGKLGLKQKLELFGVYLLRDR